MENGEKANFDSNGTSVSLSPDGKDTTVARKPKRRENWQHKIDFLFACIGAGVGLGNVWRFPYLCYINGGGAFLIPYFICVLVLGIPLFFLEVSVGQLMCGGGITAWDICPLMKGIGVASILMESYINVYYNVVLAWAFYYLFASFTSSLPWSSCGNEWNTQNCSTDPTGGLLYNNSESTANATAFYTINNTVTNISQTIRPHHVDPSLEYWQNKVLGITDGIHYIGGLKWDLTLCLLLSWVVLYLCICKGLKKSRYSIYFTVSAPYLLMIVLLIRGVTLPGALTGIKYFLVPDFSRLGDTLVWADAGTQVFFSYALCLGALVALGSYNKFNHNCFRDSILFAVVNSFTSLLAGFIIFSVLGFMAEEQGVSVDDVAESGPGLAFVVYPKAISMLPISQLWSVLFFLVIILIGINANFIAVEGVVIAIVDTFPQYLRVGRRKDIFLAIKCTLCFIGGLPMVTYGGMYVFQLFDFYAGSKMVLLVGLMESVTVAYFYGISKYYRHLEVMLGYKIGPYMKICWLILTPLATIIIFILCVIDYSELTYNKTYIYPTWSVVLGWIIACSSIVMIPLIAIIQLLRTPGSFWERVQKSIQPVYTHNEEHLDPDKYDLKDTNSPLMDSKEPPPTSF